MLGSGREADFAREAENRRLAKGSRRATREDEPPVRAPARRPKARGWLIAFLARGRA